MKNSMLAFFAFAVCFLLPSCCGKKCSSKKTAETVEQEIEVQTAHIRKISARETIEKQIEVQTTHIRTVSAKEPAELEIKNAEDQIVDLALVDASEIIELK